jgi:thiosulfate/3-mercaptopyruvate sulfurtransferase
VTNPSAALPGPVVEADWLRANAADVVIADVRWYLDGRRGRAAYDAGHLPGAVFVDLDTDLSAPVDADGLARTGRHPLPSPADFAAALGRLGIAADTPVVAYDDAGGSIAARLWWMRSVLGEPTAVLDGGMDAWTGALSTGSSDPVAVTRAAKPWPDGAFAGIDEVEVLRSAPGAVLLDARSPERYRGDPNPVDARSGHIPGARSAPWAGNLDPATGRFLGPDALRDRFVALGVTGPGGVDQVIAYCGSGVTACHDLLALARAGLTTGSAPRPRLFTGSWSAWGADPSRPLAAGDDPAGG